MFHKVNEWLTSKSERFVRGGAVPPASGTYASEGAETGFSAENAQDGAGRSQPLDPFGREGEDEYGGRVPYRSQKDMQAEQQMQETMRQQAARQAAAQQQAAQQQQAMQQQAAQQPAPGYAQQPSNVVPFPGMMRGPDGNVYGHVEYIVLLRSRNECTKVIEYIKANASVFLNMEFIANDSERQRCVDMLSGAAYTLGCALNKISPRGIYLISSPSVYVVIDQAMQKYAATPEAQGYTQAYASYAAQPAAFSRRAAAQPASSAYPGYTERQPAQPVQPAQPEAAYAEPAAQEGRFTSSFTPPSAEAQRQPPLGRGFTAASPTSSFAAQPRRAQPPTFGMQGSVVGAESYPETGRYRVEYGQ